MKIVITDSGLGGLSICGFLESLLEQAPIDSLAIKYINAVPQNDLGYNQMATRIQKIDTFEQVLDAVAKKYAPNYIFVACNTLSALMEATPFFQKNTTPLEGMIDLATSFLYKHLASQPQSGLLILATETTIAEGIYPHRLHTLGISPHRVFVQALPKVATLISNDAQGEQVLQALLTYIRKVLPTISFPFEPLYVFLGCTHYGYRQPLFQKTFEALNHPHVKILNPNQEASQKIFSRLMESSQVPSSFPVSVEFLSRYPLPANEVEILYNFLSPYAPRTAHALKNYTLQPDLF